MAGWGATGVIGAAARARDRAPHRPLAARHRVHGGRVRVHRAPGRRGLGHLQRPQRWPQLGVYVGKGIGFDAIHAAGCLVFALALGPALIRSLSRFATRLQVTWQPAVGVLVVMVASLLASQPALIGTGPGVARAAGDSRRLPAQRPELRRWVRAGPGAGVVRAIRRLGGAWAGGRRRATRSASSAAAVA